MDGGGIVIEAGPAVFEERGNEHDAEFAREFSQTVRHRPGQRIGEVEQGRILDRAEIRREEKFLRDHDVRASRRGLADERFMVIECLGLGGEGPGLEQCDARHGGTVAAPGGRRTQEIPLRFINPENLGGICRKRTHRLQFHKTCGIRVQLKMVGAYRTQVSRAKIQSHC